MTNASNEPLCALAKAGDAAAREQLIENNLRFIRKTAHEIWSEQPGLNIALGIDKEDLVQEGCIRLDRCIERFDPERESKFLTYAAPAIRNAMLDYIRAFESGFEASYAEAVGPLLSLDEMKESGQRADTITDPYQQNPEQIYLRKERIEGVRIAMRATRPRARTYLWFRFGFGDNIEHPLTETAKRFRLSESRARATEKDALHQVRRNLP
jgi:RNA polymerase primary sigma factor/RNA polymerase sporulation-specific sigma factor